MNKFHYLYFFLILLFGSCFKKEADLYRKSTGEINTISVIIDDQLWNGEIGDSIRNKFASPVIGLPEEEPLFTINQYPVKLLEGFATNSRAILIFKKATKTYFEIKKNQYASPQNVFYISGKTTSAILGLLEENTSKIISIIEKGELAERQRINKKELLSTNFLKKILNFLFKFQQAMYWFCVNLILFG